MGGVCGWVVWVGCVGGVCGWVVWVGCVGGVCGRGEGGAVFCSVCIFHNQKMHIYLISRSDEPP